MRMHRRLLALGLLLVAEAATAAPADGAPAPPAVDASRTSAVTLDTVVVTATRAPEPLDRIPVDISVVSGAELRARAVHHPYTKALLDATPILTDLPEPADVSTEEPKNA